MLPLHGRPFSPGAQCNVAVCRRAQVVEISPGKLESWDGLTLPRSHLCFSAVWPPMENVAMETVEGGSGCLDRLDLDGLAAEWDGTVSIRSALREGEKLLELTNVDIKACVVAKDVLTPLLHRMLSKECKLPDVEPLRDNIRDVYLRNKSEPDAATILGTSWQVRRLLGFIKMKVRRSEVSVEPRLYFEILEWLWKYHEKTLSAVYRYATNYGIIQWWTRSAKDRDFQQLVLILNPELKDGHTVNFQLYRNSLNTFWVPMVILLCMQDYIDQVNEKVAWNAAKRREAAAARQEWFFQNLVLAKMAHQNVSSIRLNWKNPSKHHLVVS